jgi:glycosyltransferase involved in cell wall biosynthesis
LRGLERIRPILERIGREVPGIQLKLICDRFIALEELKVVPFAWSEAAEARELADADIGIAWMPDDEWSRGKCGLKVLQYMAAGLPVIANPVGVHCAMIRHGATGFLANTSQEWVEAVAKLSANCALRKELGQAGRAIVERDYSIESGAARWLEVLEGLRRRQVA